MNNKKELKRLSKKILLSLLLGSIVALPVLNVAYALPKGFDSTTATSITEASKMNINSEVKNNVINWQAFSIADGETVDFKGHNKNYLNLVNGVTTSNIYGTLKGVGNNIYLINPNGVIFGKTAKVNVGSLGVSTRDIDSVDITSFKESGENPIKATNVESLIGDITNLGKIQAQKVSLEGRNIIIQDASHLIDEDKAELTGRAVFIKASGDVTVGHKIAKTGTLTLNVDLNNDGIYTTENYAVSDYANVTDSDLESDYKVKKLDGSKRSYTDAMLVKDIYDLQSIAGINNNVRISNYYFANGDYLLAGDIDASETAKWEGNFTPIGSSRPFMDSSFNGADNTITGLVVNQDELWRGNSQYIGLFGIVDNSTIKNVRLENFNITAANWGYAGSLAGLAVNSEIENVSSSGEINCIAYGDSFVGGLVGGLVGSSLSDSYNETVINVENITAAPKFYNTDEQVNVSRAVAYDNDKKVAVGGIAGVIYDNFGSFISNQDVSIAERKVSAVSEASTLKSTESVDTRLMYKTRFNKSIIKNSYNKGAINYIDDGTENFYIGGIVGLSVGGNKIKNTYNIASIEGENENKDEIEIYDTANLARSEVKYNSYTREKPIIGGILGYSMEGDNIEEPTFALRMVQIVDDDLSESNEVVLKKNYYAITDADGALINQDTVDENVKGITALTHDEMLQASSYGFEDDIDTSGGQHKIWRIYEGETTPLLTNFLETIVIKADDVVYSGQTPEEFIEVLEGGPLDPNKLVAISGTDVGSYIIYSDQKGYDLVTKDGTSTPILNIIDPTEDGIKDVIEPSETRIDDIIDGKDDEYNSIVNYLLSPEPNEIHTRRVVRSNVVSPAFFAVQIDETRVVQKIIDASGSTYTMDTYDGLLNN